MKNQQENKKKFEKLKSGANGLFLGVIGNTTRDHAKGITIEYR